jgi:hypothetical protein
MTNMELHSPNQRFNHRDRRIPHRSVESDSKLSTERTQQRWGDKWTRDPAAWFVHPMQSLPERSWLFAGITTTLGMTQRATI